MAAPAKPTVFKLRSFYAGLMRENGNIGFAGVGAG